MYNTPYRDKGTANTRSRDVINQNKNTYGKENSISILSRDIHLSRLPSAYLEVSPGSRAIGILSYNQRK